MLIKDVITIVLGSFAFLAMGMFFISYAYLKFTVGKKFEKLFQHIHNKDTISIYGHKEGRFDDYMELIVAYNYHKKNNTSLYKTFNGYNFREHITKAEYIFVKVYRWAIFICGTSTFIWMILMLLIYHRLDA